MVGAREKLHKQVDRSFMVAHGIGFAMSLFIGSLGFGDPEHAAGIRLGVFVGSILSGLCGYLLLRRKSARGTSGPAKRPLPVGR